MLALETNSKMPCEEASSFHVGKCGFILMKIAAFPVSDLCKCVTIVLCVRVFVLAELNSPSFDVRERVSNHLH